jgi:hypothetical protein
MAIPIPTWRERLKACFQWRHRLLHVLGIPGAVGAVTAIGLASVLTPDAGLSLGALTAAVGSVLAGYYITAGFDKKLVARLQQEKAAAQSAKEDMAVFQLLRDSHPEVKPVLERILQHYQSIEQVFNDDVHDSVEAVLQGARPDLVSLRERAVRMVNLHQRLNQIIQNADGERLEKELARIDRELRSTEAGTVKDALLEARTSTARALEQWQAAIDKRRQVSSVLTVIEKNLQEFKLAMELRKADAAMGGDATAADVSELQLRLRAAGDACDEIVGRTPAPRVTARRSREKSK